MTFDKVPDRYDGDRTYPTGRRSAGVGLRTVPGLHPGVPDAISSD